MRGVRTVQGVRVVSAGEQGARGREWEEQGAFSEALAEATLSPEAGRIETKLCASLAQLIIRGRI